MTLSSNTLYGSTFNGGDSGNGSVFAVNIDGTGFTTLYSFTAGSGAPPSLTNADGIWPNGGLVLLGNTLYGTATHGGSLGWGTVFAVNTDGTGFTTVYSFTATTGTAGIEATGINSDGALPNGGLILSGNTLYGMAMGGGSSGWGTAFKVNTDGTAFTTLHSFTGGSDGGYPIAGLVLSGDTLYGRAVFGGCWDNGTVFAVKTDGTGFTNLHSFTGEGPAPYYTNSDGDGWGELLISGNTLYGAAMGGGRWGNGTVFKVNTDGTGFTTLHSFTALSTPVNQNGSNSDGAFPWGGLILSGNTLYGTANHGGSFEYGTVFAINTDGTGFTNLHSFTSYDDGQNPSAGLSLSGNTLYGVAGVLFGISLPSDSAPPHLSIIPSGANVVLSWPTSATGFVVQSTTNLAPPAVWTTNLPAPAIFNGQNFVTNPITGTQQFFRLSR